MDSRYHLLFYEWHWGLIYVAMDVKSRWAPYVEPYLWRSGASSVEFFMNAFGEGEPEVATSTATPRNIDILTF